MKKINLEDVERIAGGVNSLSGTDAAADLIRKESQAAVCGMGTVKFGALADGSGQTVMAYCPVCRKKTKFYISSGAQSKCSECGNIRLDM